LLTSTGPRPRYLPNARHRIHPWKEKKQQIKEREPCRMEKYIREEGNKYEVNKLTHAKSVDETSEYKNT
jgi:hypothetical protein